MLELSPAACYRAIQTRDPRFDGRLFVGVRTTGIYCRPICPARTPKAQNCTFYPSAAAAQESGFRPCLRCRPERSPALASWRGTSNTVSRALDLIAEGGLDGDDQTVDQLAGRLGVGERQLRRLFMQHLGASPIAVAQTRRVLFAKQLVHDTRLPMAEIAMAAGFGSIRRFNAMFQKLYRRGPRELRRTAKHDISIASAEAVVLRLGYRPPYDWQSMLDFLSARALSGVELVEGGVYRRTLEHEGEFGMIEVANEARLNQLVVSVRFPNVRALSHIVRRVRRVFDTDADIETIRDHLDKDSLLSALMSQRPGLRTPGAWDSFELAIRAILGQQVTLQAGRMLANKLIAAYGESIRPGVTPEVIIDSRLSHVFPTAARLASAPLVELGMPRARASALSSLAAAVAADPTFLTRGQSLDEAIGRFRRLPGIGEWTAQYIALRALREPDAFPASDIGLLEAAACEFGSRPTPAELLERAEAWRPWRAYAAQHLWTAYSADYALKLHQKGLKSATSATFFPRQIADSDRSHAHRL